MKLPETNLDEEFVKDIRHFKNSVIYSVEGIITSYKHERSLKLHFFVSLFVLFLAIFFRITATEVILSIILMGMILCVELLNTSIEACVDLVTTKRHPLAKRSKDVASAASFMMSCFAGIGELIIFMPYFIKFFGG